MIRQRLVAGLVTATALVTLAACGSDSKSSTTNPLSTVAAAVSVPDVTVPDVTVPDISVPDVSVPDISVPDVSVPDISVPDISVPDISVPDVTQPELTGDCVALQKELPDFSDTTKFTTADVNKAFSAIEAKVPSDLKDDVSTIKTALQPFYDAVAKAGGDATKAMQDPEVVKQAQTAFTDPKFTEASKALDDWFTKGCPS